MIPGFVTKLYRFYSIQSRTFAIKPAINRASRVRATFDAFKERNFEIGSDKREGSRFAIELLFNLCFNLSYYYSLTTYCYLRCS